jgi:hypothetical protein
MSYVVPQVKVFQEFSQAPAAIANPLRAFIIGPNFQLVRYADDEGYLGQYDPDNDVAYSWPGRTAGAVVDQTFTMVDVKDALLRYYQNASGGADTVKGVAGYPNRIRADAINFADNPADATTYPRSTDLPARDVAVGDIARVFANVNDTIHEVWSRVTAVLPDYADPTIAAAATHDTDNFADLAVGNDVAANVGDGGGSREVSADSVTGYDGLVAGYPEEIYTVTITTASASETGALASVVSSSGTDDENDVVVAATGQEIGSRGATFDWGGSGEWNVGDQFIVVVRQDYDVPALAGAGDFDSDVDTTYIIEVTKGGATAVAEVSISTTNGLDVSGPHIVTEDTQFSIGTKGVKITFADFTAAGDGLYKGAKFYLACTGRSEEGYKTLVLADNLPAALRGHETGVGGEGPISSSSLYAAADLNLNLYVTRQLTLPRENFPAPPAVNWTQSATEIIIESGAQVYDADFVDEDGDSVALTLDADTDGLYSLVYVTYRALLQTYASDISSIENISDVTTLLGEISTDNPLALGVWHALRNANGTDVKYMAVPTNDLEGYSAVLDKATGRRDIYTVVPMTRTATIQQLVAGHVDEMSTETKGQWRICFLNGDSSAITPLIGEDEIYPIGGDNTYEADDLLATVDDDVDTTGTQYTIVNWDPTAYPAGGGFVDMAVRAGDLFRTNYVGDGFGGLAYDDYVIDAVISNQRLRLVSGPSAGVNIAKLFSIQKSQTKNEEAAAFGILGGAFAARRVYYVWPDVIEDAAGVQISGIYACAAIAGLVSGVVPQQGLTNIAIEGFTAVTRTTEYFGESQLNTMAEAGIWIIDQDPNTGEIFTRHEVSTCTTDLNCKELMVVKNVDAVSYVFLNQLKPYIGRSNITPRFLAQLRRQILSTVDYLKANGSTPTLGGQLLTAEIVELRQHVVNLDQVVAVLSITIPYPANVIELKLIV